MGWGGGAADGLLGMNASQGVRECACTMRSVGGVEGRGYLVTTLKYLAVGGLQCRQHGEMV